MTGIFVVDANAFKTIYENVVSETDGDGAKFLAAFSADDFVAVDDGGLILHEWRACSCGESDEYFREWVGGKIVADVIRQFPIHIDKAVSAGLTKFGMPKKDRKYVFLGVCCAACALVSDDIDFYDPSAKSKGSVYRRKMMANSTGCIAQYLRKHHKISVMRLQDAPKYLA